MKNLYLKIFIPVLFICFFGCKTAPVQTGQNPVGTGKINIKSVTWMIENLDTSIWNGTLKGDGQMFVSFFINYSGSFDTTDIERLTIESPADMWILNSTQLEKIIEIDDILKIAAVKRLQCGEGKGAVPLGIWNVILRDTSGKVYEHELNITGFEKKSDDKKTEEEAIDIFEKSKENRTQFIVPLASGKNEIAALNMPVIKSVSKDEDSIEIYFSVNDGRVKNGYFWFDVPGEKYYKDSGSMIDASGAPVNGCRAFSADGKECRYILRKNTDNAHWFDKIISCFFVVSDTNRVSSPWEERNRTVSAKSEVK